MVHFDATNSLTHSERWAREQGLGKFWACRMNSPMSVGVRLRAPESPGMRPAVDRENAMGYGPGVEGRGVEMTMPRESGQRLRVAAAVQEMRGERVAKDMRSHRKDDAGLLPEGDRYCLIVA